MTEGQFRDALTAEFGDAFVFSYFDRSEFTGGDHPIVRPWSLVANDKFKQEARRFLQHHGVKLGPPVCDHMKPRIQRAA